jgi:UDP-glucose 4-epimerase
MLKPNLSKQIKNILITGGAGYIGSHMVNIAVNCGYDVVVLDSLANGRKNNVNEKAKLVIGDIADDNLVKKIITENNIEAVLHFAAFIEAGESVTNPLKYYNNNFDKSVKLLDTIVASGVNYFIFSSTAAIFGEAKYTPIDEEHPKNPVNPYGKSKLMVEEALSKIGQANPNFKYGCLRYFNAAGSDYKNNLGENHNPETHLIPLLMRFANGVKNDFTVNGNDYKTRDGTCVRDYVHVLDICDAHLKLLNYLENGGTENYFNLGTKNGYSVLEVIEAVEKIVGRKLDVKYGGKRIGDAAEVVASNQKAKEILGWDLKNSDLENIINSALQWEKIREKFND